MFAKHGLVAGAILKRYQRFLADVRLEDGKVVTAHCTNTGAMSSCWEPGDEVLLATSDNPKRRLKFTWIACRRMGHWVGVDTGIPNKVVAEAARQDCLPGLPGLRNVRTEVMYGKEHSRIDVLACDPKGRQVYIEVKNTTLRVGPQARFPDAVTVRGAKHLRELRAMVDDGHRAAIVFFVHRNDVRTFDAARDVDPTYARELDQAAAAGVLVLPLRVDMRKSRARDGTFALRWSLPGLVPWQQR